MSEELLSNYRRVQKHLTPPGLEQLTSRSITRCTTHSSVKPCFFLCCNRLYFSNKLYFGDHSKMKNESVKKSHEKSKNVLEEKRRMVKQKVCIKKTITFTIIAMNFVQEQLNSCFVFYLQKFKNRKSEN